MSADRNRILVQAVHDLGSALWFGGATMGVAGVNKAGNDLRDGVDKVRVAGSAWNRYAPAEWTGVAAVLLGGAWLTGDSKGHLAVQHGWKRAGAAKAGVAVAGAAATAYAAYSGQQIGKLTEQAAAAGRPVDVQDASTPNAQTPAEIAVWQKRQRATQYLVPLLSGANIVLNSYLVQTYRPGSVLRGVARKVVRG